MTPDERAKACHAAISAVPCTGWDEQWVDEVWQSGTAERLIADAIREAVAERLEWAAKLVEGSAELRGGEFGEPVNPGLGYWTSPGGDGESEYVADEVALAARIREGAP